MNNQSIIKAQKIYFSPTKTTKKVLEGISIGMDVKFVPDIDLTRPNHRKNWKGKSEADLLLVGSPIWGQAIPPLYLRELKKLEGRGKLAVAIGVYGNVKTEEFLEQLCGLLRERGFIVIAAAYFVAQHSFNGKELNLGKDRPNKQDLTIAKELGRKITQKLAEEPDLVEKKEKPNAFLEIELESKKPIVKQTQRPLKIYPSIPVENECSKCKDCLNVCPVDCIDPDTLKSDLNECIQCMACVRFCTDKARHVVFNIPKSKIKVYKGFEEPLQQPRIWL